MKARLHIQVAVRDGKSFLKEVFHTPPFKVANITENKSSEWLQAMMMCSSPGILDGDDYDIKIVVEDQAKLNLHTQSYQRLFNMKNDAKQNTLVEVGSDASFVFIPHPAVPHAQSSFTAVNRIYLKQNSQLIWGEILTCGRQLKDEVFAFTKYHTLTDIYLEDKLIIRENLLMQPSKFNFSRMGMLEGYTHQASLLCIQDFHPLSEVMDEVYAFLQKQNDVVYGITAAPVKGFIVRMLGYKAEQLHTCLKTVAEMVLEKVPKLVVGTA